MHKPPPDKKQGDSEPSPLYLNREAESGQAVSICYFSDVTTSHMHYAVVYMHEK